MFSYFTPVNIMDILLKNHFTHHSRGIIYEPGINQVKSWFFPHVRFYREVGSSNRVDQVEMKEIDLFRDGFFNQQ
jgi:hypothetical protein